MAVAVQRDVYIVVYLQAHVRPAHIITIIIIIFHCYSAQATDGGRDNNIRHSRRRRRRQRWPLAVASE